VSAQLGELAESILVGNTQTGPFNRTPGPKYSSLKGRSEAMRRNFPAGSTGNRLFNRIHDDTVARLDHERLEDEEVDFA
jgi:hypothetical protein